MGKLVRKFKLSSISRVRKREHAIKFDKDDVTFWKLLRKDAILSPRNLGGIRNLGVEVKKAQIKLFGH